MGILVGIIIFFALVGALKKSAVGRLFLVLMLLGGIYVGYWKLTTGGF